MISGMLYSPSTGGFYCVEINGGDVPHDAVEISAEWYGELMEAQSSGRTIIPGIGGKPVLEDIPTGVHLPGSVYQYEDGKGWCWCRGVDATYLALAAEKDRIICLGLPWEGHTYQIEEKYLGNLQWFLTALSQGITNPHKGFLRDVENINVPFDDAGIKDIALAASGYYRDVLMSWGDHKDELAALVAAARAAHEGDDAAAEFAANEAAEDYDVTAGWPVFSLDDKF